MLCLEVSCTFLVDWALKRQRELLVYSIKYDKIIRANFNNFQSVDH